MHGLGRGERMWSDPGRPDRPEHDWPDDRSASAVSERVRFFLGTGKPRPLMAAPPDRADEFLPETLDRARAQQHGRDLTQEHDRSQARSRPRR